MVNRFLVFAEMDSFCVFFACSRMGSGGGAVEYSLLAIVSVTQQTISEAKYSAVS